MLTMMYWLKITGTHKTTQQLLVDNCGRLAFCRWLVLVWIYCAEIEKEKTLNQIVPWVIELLHLDRRVTYTYSNTILLVKGVIDLFLTGCHNGQIRRPQCIRQKLKLGKKYIHVIIIKIRWWNINFQKCGTLTCWRNTKFTRVMCCMSTISEELWVQ